MKKLLLIILCAVLALCLFACSDEEEDNRPVMNIDYITDEDGVTRCKYDGSEQQFFAVGDEAVIVTVRIEKLSGTINVTIAPEDDPASTAYRGTDLPSSDFSVTVSAPGRYRIYVQAEDFVGTYSFDYPMN